MASVIRRIALSPGVTGTLLFILSQGPSSLQNPLLRALGTTDNVARLTTALKWLFGLGLGAQVNRWLSSWASDKWLWPGTKNEWEWTKEVAVVTGGSSGFGALITRGLSKKGVKVIVLDVQPLPESLQNFANISYHHCDITSQSEIDRVADTIRSNVGSPSILINNAGIAHAHSILDARAEYLRRLFDVNLLSHWYLIQAFLPDMLKKEKGHIVSMASMAGFITVPNLVDYCATKAGLLSLHEGLVQELKHVYKCPQIKTTVVHPTYARTPLIESYRKSLDRDSRNTIDPRLVADAIVNQILSGRSGQIIVPGHIAPASLARAWPTWLQEILRDFTAQSMLPNE